MKRVSLEQHKGKCQCYLSIAEELSCEGRERFTLWCSSGQNYKWLILEGSTLRLSMWNTLLSEISSPAVSPLGISKLTGRVHTEAEWARGCLAHFSMEQEISIDDFQAFF